MFASTIWAGDYRDGLRAYIDGDYQTAQPHWRKAAKTNDAKSMFNLGLLHEQNRLADANNEQAKKWFRLAAENGYTAASYHLAKRMLERGGSSDEAIALIKASAEEGYAPAVRYLGGGSKPPKNAIRSAIKESPYRSENWINQQQASDWTIQLLAFKERDKVHEFIREHSLQSNAAYFAERSNGELFYKLVYGAYSSKDKADVARQNLSEDLQEYGPWLRSISVVQAAIKR